MKADDEEKVPLVSYHPHHRHFFLFRMSKHAWLEIKPEATEALDKLIGKLLPRLDDKTLTKWLYSELSPCRETST